jgi:hypothetical protein
MLPESFWEEKKRVESSFAEVFFLLMRYQRYGISNCSHCGNADLLAAQEETLRWKEEKEKEEEEAES